MSIRPHLPLAYYRGAHEVITTYRSKLDRIVDDLIAEIAVREDEAKEDMARAEEANRIALEHSK